jgi:hypothetical protein
MVMQNFQPQTTELFFEGIHHLAYQWDACSMLSLYTFLHKKH